MWGKTMNQQTDYQWFVDQLAGMTLTLVEDGKQARTFKLADKHTYTYLLFTHFGIVISGDTRISGNGVIALGYGLNWFTEKLDPDYLASKFLKKTWLSERAKAYWSEMLDQYKQELEDHKADVERERAEYVADNGSADGFYEYPPDNLWLRPGKWRSGFYRREMEGTIIDALEYLLADDEYFQSPQFLYDSLPAFQQSNGLWHAAFDSEIAGSCGYDYHPGEIGWLVAVQRTFARLYGDAVKVAIENGVVEAEFSPIGWR